MNSGEEGADEKKNLKMMKRTRIKRSGKGNLKIPAAGLCNYISR